MAVNDYNTNPDLNTTISGINIAEGCPPSGINNAIRQLMADVKQNADEQDSNVMTGATASAAGSAGLVPAPAAGRQDKPLRGDGTWADSLACSITGSAATATALYNAQGNPASLEDLLNLMKAYLPLSGGNMTGSVSFQGRSAIGYFSTDIEHGVLIQSQFSDAGAYFWLYDETSPNHSGGFSLGARNRTAGQYSVLAALPSGQLTWNGFNIVRGVNGNTADTDGNIHLPVFIANQSDQIYLPAGGTWNVLYMNWGTDWGVPYVTTLAGGAAVPMGHSRTVVFAIRMS